MNGRMSVSEPVAARLEYASMYRCYCTEAILPSVFCICAFSLLSRVGMMALHAGGGKGGEGREGEKRRREGKKRVNRRGQLCRDGWQDDRGCCCRLIR